MCQLGRSWVFVALATESVDWVGNESKVSLFTVPFFFLFINEYCSYVFKHLEHEFRESLSKYLAESSYQTSSFHERYLSLDRILG